MAPREHDVTLQIASYLADSGISNGFEKSLGSEQKTPEFFNS